MGAPNNGMHPTRDTHPVIFQQRLGRAGEGAYSYMAKFLVKDTRRLGLDRSEFDVAQVEGVIAEREIFQFSERGTLWEYVILEMRQHRDQATLFCMNWVPESGAFVGFSGTSRPMKAAERRRYEKYLTRA